jgi:hypothetical protein
MTVDELTDWLNKSNEKMHCENILDDFEENFMSEILWGVFGGPDHLKI